MTPPRRLLSRLLSALLDREWCASCRLYNPRLPHAASCRTGQHSAIRYTDSGQSKVEEFGKSVRRVDRIVRVVCQPRPSQPEVLLWRTESIDKRKGRT